MVSPQRLATPVAIPPPVPVCYNVRREELPMQHAPEMLVMMLVGILYYAVPIVTLVFVILIYKNTRK